MEDNRLMEATYQKMYEGMVTKNEPLLREVLDDSFVLVHMTGMNQSKEDFIEAVMTVAARWRQRYSAEDNTPGGCSRNAF